MRNSDIMESIAADIEETIFKKWKNGGARMKERLTRELRQKVADYHAYHGDKDVRIIRLIPDERGKLTGILVRIGDDVSAIDLEMFDYITELDSCNRAEEELMVSRYADGCENCEEGAQE